MANTEQFQSPAPFSTWVGVVLLFALFGVIVVAVIGPGPRSDTYERMRAEERVKKLKDVRDEEAKALTSYAWIDKSKGTVRLPIDRAMELTVADLANKKPASAYPIVAPESSAAPGGVAWHRLRHPLRRKQAERRSQLQLQVQIPKRADNRRPP